MKRSAKRRSPVDLARQQHAGARGDVPAVEDRLPLRVARLLLTRATYAYTLKPRLSAVRRHREPSSGNSAPSAPPMPSWITIWQGEVNRMECSFDISVALISS